VLVLLLEQPGCLQVRALLHGDERWGGGEVEIRRLANCERRTTKDTFLLLTVEGVKGCQEPQAAD
jgi:hypothetical protein